MSKATGIKPGISGNFMSFKDPDGDTSHVVTKVEPKEADGKPRGPQQMPASAASLEKLKAKFAK